MAPLVVLVLVPALALPPADAPPREDPAAPELLADPAGATLLAWADVVNGAFAALPSSITDDALWYLVADLARVAVIFAPLVALFALCPPGCVAGFVAYNVTRAAVAALVDQRAYVAKDKCDGVLGCLCGPHVRDERAALPELLTTRVLAERGRAKRTTAPTGGAVVDEERAALSGRSPRCAGC